MISTAITDIETSNLDADGGIILCGVVKSSLTGYHVFRTDELNTNWKKGLRGDDSEITRRLINIWNKHDIIVAHNGVGFDIAFVRSRALHWDLPRVPDYKIVDPLKLLWKHFKLRRNSLGSVGDFIGASQRKDVLDMSIWQDAVLNGTRTSMDHIVEHCVSDVELLEQVLNKIKPYVKQFDSRGSDL